MNEAIKLFLKYKLQNKWYVPVYPALPSMVYILLSFPTISLVIFASLSGTQSITKCFFNYRYSCKYWCFKKRNMFYYPTRPDLVLINILVVIYHYTKKIAFHETPIINLAAPIIL